MTEPKPEYQANLALGNKKEKKQSISNALLVSKTQSSKIEMVF
jgi:hypothetical protein